MTAKKQESDAPKQEDTAKLPDTGTTSPDLNPASEQKVRELGEQRMKELAEKKEPAKDYPNDLPGESGTVFQMSMNKEWSALTPEQMQEVKESFTHQCNENIRGAKAFFSDFTNDVSDGYHTFGELYAHRHALMIALCRAYPAMAWRSKRQSDGQEFEGWFLLGLRKQQGRQITYHLPMEYWDQIPDVAILEVAPAFDGHSPRDVYDRLMILNKPA